MKKVISIAMACVMLCLMSVPTFAASTNIVINGNPVRFTSSTGYPFVDENNRTLVPLRVTMESAGFAVGYDSAKETAIVITPYDRIEIPIGTNYIYNNNQLTENDTNAVVYNGRTYLPIRAVLESAGFTVEWDNRTGTVNAYTFDPYSNDLVPYSTSSLPTLIDNVLSGNVVYVNGQYYATPSYAKGLASMQVNYLSDDLNKAIYPYEDRFALSEDFDFDIEYEKQSMAEDWIDIFAVRRLSGNQDIYFGMTIDDGDFVYAFYESGFVSNTIYVCDDVPDDFEESDYNEGTFNGIRMKYEDSEWYFNPTDLEDVGII